MYETPLQLALANGTRITSMARLLKCVAILSCLLLPVSASERRSRIDLAEILRNPAALKRMSLMWQYPPNVALYIYGDGRLRLQAYPVIRDDPDDPFVMSNRNGLFPTCRAETSTDQIKSIVGLLIERHFFDLPEKTYIYMTVANERRKLELHTIALDDGKDRADRTFGIGRSEGRDEFLPADFAAIEDALVKLRDATFPLSQKPCGVANRIRFGGD